MMGDFRIDEEINAVLGTKVDMVKHFYLNTTKYTQDAIEKLVQKSNRELTEWENAVGTALGDVLPVNMRHRPRDPSRRYPHENSGKLKGSISAGAYTHRTQTGITITSWATLGDGVDYLQYANHGVPGRKDGNTPQWIGWVERVFTEGDNARGIRSVSDIFKELTDARHVLSRGIK